MVLTPSLELRRAVRITGFASVTATMLAAYTGRDAITSLEGKGKLRDRWVRRWSDALLGLFGITVDIVGSLPPPPRAGRLVVMNHRSTIDIALALRTFGGVMVSRADLATWPILGPAARKVGTIFVDRSAAMSGASVVRTMHERLARGATVNVFPEGTTFADDEVRPFHPGAFVAALNSGCEIVPVGVAYEQGSGAAFVNEGFGAHLARMAAAPPSRVVMAIGNGYVVKEGDRSRILVDRAWNEVRALVGTARATVDRRPAA